MKHNIEGIEAFAWQPQTPVRARASSLSGACALLSKLSSSSSGSLLREGSLGQVCANSWPRLEKDWPAQCCRKAMLGLQASLVPCR